MSAFQCSPSHIAAIIGTAHKLDPSRTSLPDMSREMARHPDLAAEYTDSASFAGALLARENARSLDHRYAHHSTAHAWAAPSALDCAMWYSRPLSPIALIKAIQCLDYQSCEHDAWSLSDAKRLLDQIARAAISKMDGYEEAAWSL